VTVKVEFFSGQFGHCIRYGKIAMAVGCMLVLCQDSGIALKIFELALKRYGMQPECVWEYINYMSRLNGNIFCFCPCHMV